MGSVAASGGYWVATAGDHIFAEPETITGSIGVFGILPSFEGTLEKLGLGVDGVATTPLTGEPDLLRGPSDNVDRLIQLSVASIYRRFVRIVAETRDMPVDRVPESPRDGSGTPSPPGSSPRYGGSTSVGESSWHY